MVTANDRRLLAVLGLSVALHAAVLAWVRGPRHEARDTIAALTATLRLAAPIESGSALAEPALAAPRPIPKEARQLPPRRDPRPASGAAGAAAPPLAAVPAGPVAGAAPPVEQRGAAAPQAVAEAVPAPSPAAPLASLRDQAALLDTYGHRLSELLAHGQEYPRLAALRGWEGEVRLRIKVARKGNLLGVLLDRSSGYDILDQHALQFVQQIRGLPPLPEGLEGGEIQVVVPVSYRLKRPA